MREYEYLDSLQFALIGGDVYINFQRGIVRLKWDSQSPLVYTCSLDGTCNLWDTRSGLKETTWYGHVGEVLDMAVAK